MFLENFLQIFKIFSRFLKLHDLGSNFNLKCLRLKIVLNSITTLKRHLQASLNVFFNKKVFDDDNFF